MKAPIIFGKYLLLERISVGGMAEVFLAKSFGVEGFERLLAIKRILPSMAEDDEFITMFIDEARISSQLNHANVVHIHELGRSDESYYIAMEYVPGLDLKQIAEVYRRERQPMPVPQAVFIASKLSEGLDYAHRKKDQRGQPLNIVHRDVSPQNVLVSFEGEVKIIDFGIAKAESRRQQTQVGILKGKFGYMSPEQALGNPIDRRSDLFAVGTLLYEMLTGDRLFVGESDYSVVEKVRNADVVPPRELNPEIPKGLEKIILKALARDADARYQWCSELQEDLLRYLVTDGAVYSSKQLSAFMKEVFAGELAREAERMERFASATRPELAEEASALPRRRTSSKPAVAAAAPPRRQTGEAAALPKRSVTGESVPSKRTVTPAAVAPAQEEEGHERTQIVDASMFLDAPAEAMGASPKITAAPAHSMTAQDRPEPSVVVEDTGVYEEAAREAAAEHSSASGEETGPHPYDGAPDEVSEATPIDAQGLSAQTRADAAPDVEAGSEPTPELPLRGTPAGRRATMPERSLVEDELMTAPGVEGTGRAGHAEQTRAARPGLVPSETVITSGELRAEESDSGEEAPPPEGATRMDAVPEDPAFATATRITMAPEEDVARETRVARPASSELVEETNPRVPRRRTLPTRATPSLATRLRQPKLILAASGGALALLVIVLVAALSGGGDEGALLILAEPRATAQITLDGQPVANGQVLTGIAPGRHELVVSAPGHQTHRQQITVSEGQATLPVELRAEVVAQVAEASTAPPPPAALPAAATGAVAAKAGDAPVRESTTVASAKVSAGPSEPVASTAMKAPPPAPKPAVTTAPKPRPVAAAAPSRTASRKRVTGRFACSSVPLGAEVLIDGRPVGRKTPIAMGNPLELPVGKYRLTLRANGKSFTTPIEITEGEYTTVRGAVLE